MKKIFSIGLSFFFLLQSINLHASDIVHIGDLIEHAQLHAQEFNDDWMSFLSKHYGSAKIEHEHQSQSDEQEHEDLPFTDHLCSTASSILFISPEHISSLQPREVKHLSNTFLYKLHYSFEGVGDIFQPPKSA